MELTVGGKYFYNGGDSASDMKARNVELIMVDAFGMEGEVIVRALDDSKPNTQMVSAEFLSEYKEGDGSVEIEEVLQMFDDEETTTTKGDVKMKHQELKAGDVVVMTKVSPADVIMAGLEEGDRVTILAGVGEVVPAHEILSSHVVGTINDDDVAIGVTDRGTPALIGDNNDFDKE